MDLDDEQPTMSVQQRIAALNLNKSGSGSGTGTGTSAATKKAPPPPPKPKPSTATAPWQVRHQQQQSQQQQQEQQIWANPRASAHSPPPVPDRTIGIAAKEINELGYGNYRERSPSSPPPQRQVPVRKTFDTGGSLQEKRRTFEQGDRDGRVSQENGSTGYNNWGGGRNIGKAAKEVDRDCVQDHSPSLPPLPRRREPEQYGRDDAYDQDEYVAERMPASIRGKGRVRPPPSVVPTKYDGVVNSAPRGRTPRAPPPPPPSKRGHLVPPPKSPPRSRSRSQAPPTLPPRPAVTNPDPPPLPQRRGSGWDADRPERREPTPSLRPPLPQRSSTSSSNSRDNVGNRDKSPTPRRLPPPPAEWRSKSPSSSAAPSLPPRPRLPPRPSQNSSAKEDGDVYEPAAPIPPPVPLASRPKFRPQTSANSSSFTSATGISSCLICRDFSAPDAHATRFPRNIIPPHPDGDPVVWLAHALTSPFRSPTDRARVIFTWLHHNIMYDAPGFFAGVPRNPAPTATLQSGLAVCEGYSQLFMALGTAAGLHVRLVHGHGKGIGHEQPPAGVVPGFASLHAWNAVWLEDADSGTDGSAGYDSGYGSVNGDGSGTGSGWKLIDSCWGAGSVMPDRSYSATFNPSFFTMPNTRFAHMHFPESAASNQYDTTDFYFPPSARPPTWREYICRDADAPEGVERPRFFIDPDGVVGPLTLKPEYREIEAGPRGNVSFSFGLLCPHYRLTRPPFLPMLATDDGVTPLQHYGGGSGGGDYWALETPRRRLGRPGAKPTLVLLTSFCGAQGDEVRGISAEEFDEVRFGGTGYSMAWQVLAEWEIV